MARARCGSSGFDVPRAVEGLDALCGVSGLDGVLFSLAAAQGAAMGEGAGGEPSQDGLVLHHDTGGCARCCARFHGAWGEECRKTHASAGLLADRYGGVYVYVCPEQKLFIAAPIVRARSLAATMLLGPADVTEDDDEAPRHPGRAPFPHRDSRSFHDLAVLLSALAAAQGDGQRSYLRQVGEEDEAGRPPAPPAARRTERSHMTRYPVAAELALRTAVRDADPVAAHAALDRIFAYLLIPADGNSEYLDLSRAQDLVVVIARAAIEAGVDADIAFRASRRCDRELRFTASGEQVARRMRLFADEAIGFVQARRGAGADDVVYRVQSYVRSHLRDGATLSGAAKAVGFSAAYLSRVFRQRTGESLTDYVNRMRVEAAKLDLSTTDYPIAQIASRAGFSSSSYFTRVFRRFTGTSPGAFRAGRDDGNP